MRRQQKHALVILAALLVAPGCDSPPGHLDDSVTLAAWGEPDWGEQIEGLQCRLRPARRTWQPGEVPIFRVDIRNQGKRTFAFLPDHGQQLCRVQFDGKWHHWPNPVTIDSPVRELSPGAEFNDVTITLHERLKIDISPGTHIVRVAFFFEGIPVTSNPVGIRALQPNTSDR